MKQRSTLWPKLLPLALAVGAVVSARAQTTYSQVPLTAASFTADIVANGAAALPPASSTTADADNASYYLISQDYYTSSIAHTSGLPNNGAIPNSISGLSGLTYQLASLSANNSLRLTGSNSGTVTFVTPRAASDVYVLGVSGSGLSTVDVTVNYADGTTTAFPARTYADWFDVVPAANVFGSTGRGSATVPVSTPYAAAGTAPYLSQLRLPIPSNKLNLNITGITFAKTTATGGATTTLNIMAVSVGSTPLCTAPPTSITTVASTSAAGTTPLTTACTGSSIYLSVTGVPSNAGYTYQWQSSTTSATAGFTDISGATSATYVATGQTVATYYRVLVGCQFATGSTPTASTAVQVAQSPYTDCYCTPSYANGTASDAITRVRLGVLDNASSIPSAAPRYTDYTLQQTGAGATLPIPAITTGTTATVTLNFGADGTQFSAVWIDFNHDGVFGTTEYFTTGTNAGGNGTAAIAVAVPTTALTGNVRMRVRGGDDVQPTSSQPCGVSGSTYGEGEDYLVNITTAVCTPAASFTYGNASTFCTGAATNPTVTLATGATAGTFTASPAGLTISATTGTITLSSSTPGTYTVTNTVASGSCTANVTVATSPTAPTITSSGTAATGITLTSSATTGNQWYLNGTAVTGATGPTYFVNSGTRNGSYTVVVTNAAGCRSAASAAASVTVTGTTAAQTGATLTLAPNPTPDGHLSVALGGFTQTAELSVYNALGQRVRQLIVPAAALSQPQALDLSALAPGVYVLHARSADGALAIRRLVRE